MQQMEHSQVNQISPTIFFQLLSQNKSDEEFEVILKELISKDV